MENRSQGLDRALALMSILLGYKNLVENREQSKQNDVQSANDKQAKYLIEELNAKFEEQNKVLRLILEKLS